MTVETPLRGVTAALCPVCQGMFAQTGRQLYSIKLCRDTANRRRKQATSQPVKPPTARPRGAVTVYECEGCGARSLGSPRCEECRTFMRKAGLGGLCPHCEEPVTVTDLLREEVVSRGIK
jgi:RecJ-like exonuclease